MTRTIHSILQVIGFLISAGTVATNIVPAKYQPYVVLVVSAAQGILAWYNHNFNPDGTPASVAYVAKLLILFLLLGGSAAAQTQSPTQYFVASTTAGSYGGGAVAIASLGAQLIGQPTYGVSIASEFISNPNDSSKPHIGSGVLNVTKPLASFFPSSFQKKLLIDLTNYNLTFQAGGGVESLSNGVSLPRTKHIVGNFGIYGSYPLPGGHSQVGVGYKWIVGPGGGTVKVPMGQLSFTF